MPFFSSKKSGQKSKPSGGSSQRHGGSGSRQPSSAAEDNTKRTLDLDVNGLYILLTDQGMPGKWHWGLYLHRGTVQGWIFHITRPTGFWFYDHRSSNSVIYSVSVVTALKIAVVDPAMHEALRDRLSQVPLEDTDRFGTLTCRTWLLRALVELDNEGYISLLQGIPVETVEQEAKDAAVMSESGQGQKERESQYSWA